MAILFDRDVKVIVAYQDSGLGTDSDEFHILSGYTVSVSDTYNSARSQNDTLDITGSRTPGKTFTDEIGTAKFSFTTYADWDVDTNVETPHRLLWQALVGTNTSTSATSSEFSIDFSESNVASLLPLKIWFRWENANTHIHLTDVTIDKVEIDLDLEGITTLTWSGTGLNYYVDSDPAYQPPSERVLWTPTNCLINKLSTTEFSLSGINFNLPLLSSSISIDNNNNYHTRSKVGYATRTTGHVPGVLTFTLNLKTYFRTGGFGTGNVQFLIESMSTFRNNVDSLETDLKINIGGNSAPILEIDTMPGNESTVLLKYPKVEPGDSLTMDLEFISKDTGDYPTIKYII